MVDEHGSCATCGVAQDAVVMLDSDVAPPTTQQHVVRGGDTSMRWLALLGVVVVGIVGWSILSPGGADQPSSDEALDNQSTSTTAPSELHDSSTSVTSQSAEDSEQVSSSRPAVGMVLPGGPLSNTGLTLVAGNPLTLLDLDTGEVRVTEVEHAQPIALIGDRLIFAPVRAGTLRSLDINDLEAEAQDFELARSSLFSFGVGSEPGTIVAVGDDATPGPTLSQFTYDGLTGKLLKEVPIDVGFGVFEQWADLGDFNTPRAGGVYRIDTEGLSRVGEGRVVAQGGGIVLVQTCDDALQCELQWHDGQTYEQIELPAPSVITDGQVLEGGRVLVYQSTNRVGTSLFDLETGKVIVSALTSDEASHGVSIDSGAQFVAFSDQESLQLRDLVSGETTEVLFVGVDDNQGDYGMLLINTP